MKKQYTKPQTCIVAMQLQTLLEGSMPKGNKDENMGGSSALTKEHHSINLWEDKEEEE